MAHIGRKQIPEIICFQGGHHFIQASIQSWQRKHSRDEQTGSQEVADAREPKEETRRGVARARR